MTDVRVKANQLEKELVNYLTKTDKNPRGCLFHYTDFKGLVGILQSRQFWLTDHKYLNDPSEINHGKNLILKFIEKHIETNLELKFILRNMITNIIDQGYKTI